MDSDSGDGGYANCYGSEQPKNGISASKVQVCFFWL